MPSRRLLFVLIVAMLAFPLFAGTPAPETYRLLKKGTDGVPASNGEEPGRRRAPWIEIAADKETLDDLWAAEVPGKPGEIDFRSETVVFLLLGVQSTGGYAIEPISVEPPNDGVLRVHARLVQPMSDEASVTVLTAPYAVIAVRARGISKVEWVNDDGRLLATRIVE